MGTRYFLYGKHKEKVILLNLNFGDIFCSDDQFMCMPNKKEKKRKTFTE